jgi:ferritin-like metal-binding protein YciE
MKFFSANIEDLRTLYIDSLQKAFDMEKKITDALPKMIDKASDHDLANAFATHLEETRGHVRKLEALLRQATGEATTTKCKVISALTTEAEDMVKDATDPSVRDVALIAAGQQVEHHEIAVYGTLRSWAELLGLDDHTDVLEQILEHEKNADELLSNISDRVNVTAETTAGRVVA